MGAASAQRALLLAFSAGGSTTGVNRQPRAWQCQCIREASVFPGRRPPPLRTHFLEQTLVARAESAPFSTCNTGALQIADPSQAALSHPGMGSSRDFAARRGGARMRDGTGESLRRPSWVRPRPSPHRSTCSSPAWNALALQEAQEAAAPGWSCCQLWGFECPQVPTPTPLESSFPQSCPRLSSSPGGSFHQSLLSPWDFSSHHAPQTSSL